MTTTKLQSLTTLWQEFNLTDTQKRLDDLAGQITERQDESDASRKNLIEQIRNFKKTNSDETRQVVAPLLKSFQNEVDSLSKRSKATEKAFFDIYKKFCDIADPVPTLEYCMETMKSLHKLQDLEIENKQLKETVGEYSEENKRLKAVEKEHEATKVKLENYQQGRDAEVSKKADEYKEKLNDEFNEKVKNFEEEKIMSSQKLADAEQKLRGLQKILDECQAELYELKFSQDNKRSAISDEVEILLTDLERANLRASTAEKEVVVLQEKILEIKAQESDTETDTEAIETAQLKVQLNAKEREAGQLLEDVGRLTRQLADTEQGSAARLAAAEKRLQQLVARETELLDKLNRQKDYDQVKKDLSILKTLEFSNSDTFEESQDDNRPLEVLILERSKILQSENSVLRLEKERMSKEIQELKSDLDGQSSQVAKQGELIAQLEDHVEQLQTISTPYREEAEGRASADILAEVLLPESPSLAKEGSASPVLGQDQSGTMLSIVQAQRERLRIKSEELEQLNEQQLQQLSLLQSEVKTLQQDNVKLYEKIRYLQSCGGRGSAKETVVPLETRYKTSYEQKLDPFTTFSQEEKRRKYLQLSVFEKIILSLVRFITGNKTARLAVFFYSILLHGLVFAVLYKLAWTESCRHDMAAKWHEKYIQHMEAVHGHDEGPDHHAG